MKCYQCGAEFSGNFCPQCGAEVSRSFCPECGAESSGSFCPQCGARTVAGTPVTPLPIQRQQQFYQQPVPELTIKPKKKKKPFFLRWWFILLAILAISFVANNMRSGGEKIVWDEMILGEMLPAPPAGKGRILYNKTEELWVKINKISDKQFAEYIEACKEKGFTVDAESDSNSYEGYNAEGYKLKLSHYGGDADMGINLEKPMEMTAIVWPTSTAGKQLPTPKSTIGKFSYEYDDHFLVYIGNTTKADYTEYANACSEKGFNVDYSKGDNYYRANNKEGWRISISYEGNNIMCVSIDAPRKDDSSNDTATPPAETTAPDVKAESADTRGLGSDFKAAMDSYEKFIDEYVAFMKKYNANSSDLSLLADYGKFMIKYVDFVDKFEKWEDEDLNAAETAYYIEVQTRVNNKLLEVATG